MTTKTILKIALVPIWLLITLFSLQYIFGLISEPNTSHVILGVILLSAFIACSLILFNKICLKNE